MTRLISGVALAAAALAAILLLPLGGLRLLASLVAVLAAHEYFRVVRPGPDWAGAAPALLLVALTCWSFSPAGPATLLALILLSLAWLVIEVLFRGVSLQDASAAFLAPWYIGMPLGMLVSVQGTHGARATLLLLATVVVSDSAQYYSGRAFGRRPLAPAISPKKTVEGALGGALFGTLFMAVVGTRVLPDTAPLPMAALGLSLVGLGICGDLFESRLKRAGGIKDSSSLIPGHGGVLDRIDALLFAVPPFYLFLRGGP